MPPEPIGLLYDIREAPGYIREDIGDATFAEFVADRRTRPVVERNPSIVGEAILRIARRYPQVETRMTDVPRIIAFRNALVHGYHDIDYEQVWRVIKEHLPRLVIEVETLLSEFDPDFAG